MEIAFRVAKEWDVVKVRITEEGQQRVEALQSQGRCVGCGEPMGGETPKCGLHPTCYQATRRAIAAGRRTVNELIREGKMLPPGRKGRKPSNSFTRELSDR